MYARKRMDSRLLSGTVEMLILDVISHESSYGYEIAQQVLGRSGGYFQLTEGSLYPALHRLERQQLLSSYWQEVNGGAKYYRLSPAGKKCSRPSGPNGPVLHAASTACWERPMDWHDEAAGGLPAPATTNRPRSGRTFSTRWPTTSRVFFAANSPRTSPPPKRSTTSSAASATRGPSPAGFGSTP